MDISPLMEKSFTDVYDEFLYACSHGDYLSVESLLEDGTISDSDISTTVGQQKFSPILTAIERNHLQVIKILLDHLPYGDFREALLLAIYLDLTKIAQLIMEHDTFKCFYGTFADWQTDTVKTFDESHFGGIRPIQLAAQYNRTTILYNFLKQGERIEIPHKTECQCNECKSAGLTDSLRHSQLRLSTYRGLSSDVYLALVSQDPFASAFDLSNELSNLIKNEPNFQTEYLFLFNQVSHFTGRLVDHIQNEIELELLITIERLNLAIEHDQQEFITHTTTQQHLTNIWYRNIDFTKSDTLKNPFLAAIYYILMYIPMYIGYFWFPFYFENRCQWYFQQPAIQALFHTILYQVFLLLLILSGMIKSPKISLKKEYPQIFEYSDRLFTIDEETLYYHRNLMTYLNISVLIFMLGFVCQSLRRIIKQRRCLKIMEMFMASLFVLYILLYTIAAIRVHLEWQSILDIDKWKRFEQLFNGKN
jgi:transient receptor potential cation channel subfamily C protein 4